MTKHLISIHPNLRDKRNREKHISVKSDFFEHKEEYIIKVYEDCITFERPTMDYRGFAHKAFKKKSGWMGLSVASTTVPTFKTKEFDLEDSTEDIMVCYY